MKLCTPISARGLKPASELAKNRQHGDRLRYMGGCRCAECRRANTDYEKARVAARKAGDWNGIVSADKARAHMLKLSRQGVGRRAVQAVTDIADSILHQIRTGQKTRIRARTERLILAVTKEQAADNALVSAAPTWGLINKLLAKGYTKTRITHALGNTTHALQIGKEQVTVRTAFEVAKYYNKCVANGVAEVQRVQDTALPKGTYSPRPGVLIHRMEGR